VTPDGTRLYVDAIRLISPFQSTAFVAVVDTATKTVVAEIPFLCPWAIAFNAPTPQSKDDCKNGGYQRFGSPGFRNQGQCLKYVKEHAN